METEIRFYYSLESEEKIINKLKKIKELEYDDKYYETTEQYNHPMKEYDFYQKKIDGRFRVRRTIGEDISKCMITWKRRLNDKKEELIHQEEEVELNIDINEYDNLCFLLENVLHLEMVESYERYRSVFSNKEIEFVVDEYPFGICLEIEDKSNNSNPKLIVEKWLTKLNLDINEAYRLSWDDKYLELCNEQHKKVESIVRFDKEMPKVTKKFTKSKC